MILVCEKCSTRYMSKAEAFLPEGRTVRCANCGHSWFQKPEGAVQETPPPVEEAAVEEAPAAEAPKEAPADAAPAPVAKSKAPIDKLRAKAQRRHQNRITPNKIAGLAACAAVLGGLVLSLNVFSADIVRAWPKAASAYALIGQDVNARGLVIENVSYKIIETPAAREIVVTGDVRNVSKKPVTVPLLRAAAEDAAGTEIEAFRFAAKDDAVAPGAATSFTGRAPARLDIRAMEVRFVGKADERGAF